MNERIQKLFDECGTVIDPLNMLIAHKEIEFLRERIIATCADLCANNPNMTGDQLSNIINDHFHPKDFVKYEPDDGPLSYDEITSIMELSSATNIPDERFTESLFDKE